MLCAVCYLRCAAVCKLFGVRCVLIVGCCVLLCGVPCGSCCPLFVVCLLFAVRCSLCSACCVLRFVLCVVCGSCDV